MKTYMIGYDLRKPGRNYDNLIAAIKGLGTWWHCLDSTWLIKSNQTAAQIRDYLVQHIDSNDVLLVAGITGESAWRGLSDECASWLRTNL